MSLAVEAKRPPRRGNYDERGEPLFVHLHQRGKAHRFTARALALNCREPSLSKPRDQISSYCLSSLSVFSSPSTTQWAASVLCLRHKPIELGTQVDTHTYTLSRTRVVYVDMGHSPTDNNRRPKKKKKKKVSSVRSSRFRDVFVAVWNR